MQKLQKLPLLQHVQVNCFSLSFFASFFDNAGYNGTPCSWMRPISVHHSPSPAALGNKIYNVVCCHALQSPAITVILKDPPLITCYEQSGLFFETLVALNWHVWLSHWFPWNENKRLPHIFHNSFRWTCVTPAFDFTQATSLYKLSYFSSSVVHTTDKWINELPFKSCVKLPLRNYDRMRLMEPDHTFCFYCQWCHLLL
jgi:hypothetical protein